MCLLVRNGVSWRGLTAVGKSSRGLGKGHGFNKPKGGSRRAYWNKQSTLICEENFKNVDKIVFSVILGDLVYQSIDLYIFPIIFYII